MVSEGETDSVIIPIVYTEVFTKENITCNPNIFLSDVENGISEPTNSTRFILVVSQCVSSRQNVLIRLKGILLSVDDVSHSREFSNVVAIGETSEFG